MKRWKACLPAWFMGLSIGSAALAQGVSEYALKSVLLYKLPQFVYRADDNRDQPLGMCLLGNNPFGTAMERLAQNPIEGRPVRYLRIGGPGEATACHFVFIARSETANLETTLRRLGSLPVVTVSDIDGFARAGGMVELALGAEGSGISIVINRKAAQRRGIEFNAQLLRLAKVIE